MIHWGIIGCGDVCEVKSGPAFSKVDDSNLVAVMRRDIVKAEDFARRHNVPKFYSDAAQLINDPEVNAIYIATPPSSHEDYLLQALQAKKPVYVEKPVSVSVASCERMLRAATASGVPVSVAHYRRGLPLFRKVKSLLQHNTLGTIRLVRITTQQPEKDNVIPKTEAYWRINPEVSGGGLFFDLSPHQLDILYWLFGEPKEYYGRSINQSKRYAAPDITMAEAVFQQDVCFQGMWAFNVAAAATEDRCEIVGEKGMLRFSFFKKSTLEIITDRGTEILEFDYPENIQLPMIADVVKYFRGEGPNPCSLEEAMVVLRMMEKTLS